MTTLLLALGLAFSPLRPASPDSITIHGHVTYADGRPVAGCQVMVLHPGFEPLAEARCDDAGRYEVRLVPGTYNGIAILDDGYARTTLEFWAWNVDADRDREISAVMDRLEVYDLAVWNSKGGSQSFFVSFRPMSLDRFLAGAEPEPRLVDGEEVAVLDLAPALDADRIEVLLDGRPVAVEAVQWYHQRVPGEAGDVYLPTVLVQVRRPDLSSGPHAVRVRIRDAATGATGEAVTDFRSNEAGFGF